MTENKQTAGKKTGSLRKNINRLVVVAAVLILLKLFTYAVQEFLPVFGFVLGKILTALLPFILAFLLAFLLEPLVVKVMKLLKIKRTYASLLVVIIAIILIILLLILLGSRLYIELAELATTFPTIYERTVVLLTNQATLLQNYLQLNPEIKEAITSSSQDIITSLQALFKKGSLALLAFLGALPRFLAVTVITLVATLLTSMSFPAVKEWFFNRIKGKYRSKAKVVAGDLGAAMVGYLRAQTILVAVTMIISTVGLLLIGNKYAFTVGILVGFFDLVPIIGPSVIFIPWTLVLLFTEGIGAALKIFVIYIAATVVRQILEPKILSQSIGLHPLPTLISMYVGLTLFGVGGLILGPAVIVVYEAARKAGLLKGD